jgi:hypothetical protein
MASDRPTAAGVTVIQYFDSLPPLDPHKWARDLRFELEASDGCGPPTPTRKPFNPWLAGWRFHLAVISTVVVAAFIASRFFN